jgi:hypothetical protein
MENASYRAILFRDFKRAIASFDKALEIKPDDHLASKNRTIALKKLGIV